MKRNICVMRSVLIVAGIIGLVRSVAQAQRVGVSTLDPFAKQALIKVLAGPDGTFYARGECTSLRAKFGAGQQL